MLFDQSHNTPSAVGYARTSLSEERSNWSWSVEAQTKAISLVARKLGLNLIAVFKDDGCNEHNFVNSQCGLMDMLESTSADWSTLITLCMNRLFSDRVKVMSILKSRGKIIECISERFDLDSIMSESKSIDVSAYDSAPMIGGAAPYGYHKVDGVLEVDPVESEHVVDMFETYLECLNLNTVVRKFNELGIPTRRGKHWSRTAVFWILKNQAYLGMTKRGELVVMGAHEPIVPFDLFKAVQRELNQRVIVKNSTYA